MTLHIPAVWVLYCFGEFAALCVLGLAIIGVIFLWTFRNWNFRL